MRPRKNGGNERSKIAWSTMTGGSTASCVCSFINATVLGKTCTLLMNAITSKMCHRCKQKQPMPLWKRTYRCLNCGLVMDRDENSSINIYQRFLAGLPPHTSFGE